MPRHLAADVAWAGTHLPHTRAVTLVMVCSPKTGFRGTVLMGFVAKMGTTPNRRRFSSLQTLEKAGVHGEELLHREWEGTCMWMAQPQGQWTDHQSVQWFRRVWLFATGPTQYTFDAYLSTKDPNSGTAESRQVTSKQISPTLATRTSHC